MKEFAEKNIGEIFIFVFYAGHGAMYDDDQRKDTWMIHSCGEP